MIAQGAAWLDGQLKASCAQAVTYTQKSSGKSIVGLLATWEEAVLKLFDARGQVKIIRTDRSFTFSKADLKIDGLPIDPDQGDTVTVGTEGFELMHLGHSEPSWRYTDPFKTRIRVHCKRA